MGIAIILPKILFTDSNLGKVTLVGNVPVAGVSIDSHSSYIGTEANLNVLFSPTNTTQRNVEWSIISGGSYASIDSETGVLSINSNANKSPVTVKVTSLDNPSLTDTKPLIVSYSEAKIVELEYIGTDGYVDLGVTANNTVEIDITYLLPNIQLGSNERQAPFWCYDTYIIHQPGNDINVRMPNGSRRFAFDNSKQRVYYQSSHYVRQIDNVIDDGGYYSNTSQYDDSYNMTLCGTLWESHTRKRTDIYSVIIYKDGTKIFDIIPVLVDGVPMFLDKVDLNLYSINGSTEIAYMAKGESTEKKI